jgi:hypothetical protein
VKSVFFMCVFGGISLRVWHFLAEGKIDTPGSDH